MQAIAKDGVLPKFLAKGYGPTNQPRMATLVVFGLGMTLAIFTNINQIVPIMTMVCLVSYGLINFIAFTEALIKNPSWRPTFRIPSLVSLIGSLGCFLTMLMINVGATFIVILLVIALCLWTSSRKLNANWDDIRYSLFSYFVHKGTVKLSKFEKSAKNWRPHILALFDSQTLPKNLAFFAHALNQEKGFLTFGASLHEHTDNLASELKKNLQEFNIPSHVHVNSFADPVIAADQMIKNYGFGILKPNTILLSIPTQFKDSSLTKLILDIHSQKKNVVLLNDDARKDYLFSNSSKKKQINLWWRGKHPGNFEFSLALAFLLQQSKLWPLSKICIKVISKDEENKQSLIDQLEKYRARLRIKNLEFSALVEPVGSFFSCLAKSSKDADLTFLGLRRPDAATSVDEYTDYYAKLMENTRGLNNIAYVLSGENVRFRKIFL